MRGAWIEIKLCIDLTAFKMSLPVRGAWIEISLVVQSPYRTLPSLPVRGAWIEIC